MNQGKYVFSQIATFLPARLFDRCVSTFKADKWIKHFTCWNQLLCMMFGQLSNRDSLRDLLICVNAHKSKRYHLGLVKAFPGQILRKQMKNVIARSLKCLLMM